MTPDRATVVASIAANARDADTRMGRVVSPKSDYVTDAIELLREAERQVLAAYRSESKPLPECPIHGGRSCGCPRHG